MRILLFLVLALTEVLYITMILNPQRSSFEVFLLILMFLVSLFIRFILYSTGYAPKWNMAANLPSTRVRVNHILERENHYEPPRTRRGLYTNGE